MSYLLEDLTAPIWIDNLRVDSATMLEAYMACARTEHPWYGRLKMEQHVLADHGTRVAGVPPCCLKAQCTVPNCFRCEIQQGGYRFNWMHGLWLAYYEEHKRNGAWSISESPEETASLDAAWRSRQPEHQRKMRAKMEAFHRALHRALRAADGNMLTYIKNLYATKETVGP